MSAVCPRCLMRFERHFVVKARCTKRWRGANFDAAAAQGNLAAAIAGVLGMRVRTTSEMEAFMQRVFVRAYGEALDPNPAAEFDTSEGERFEFHVGLREPTDDVLAADIEREATEAVAKSRHFVLDAAHSP